MKAIINSVFEQIQQDSDLRRFYKDCDYGVVKNKYAYFISQQIDAPYDLMFPDISEVHEKVSKNKQTPISVSHFEQMKKYFSTALDK